MKKTFRIDYLPESALQCRDGFAVVAVDVIRATTTAVTAASLGWDCYPVGTLEAAWELAHKSDNPLLVGEINGVEPAGFNLTNSPAQLAALKAPMSCPLILLSSSGTRLIANASGCDILYLSCFRNASSTAHRLIRERHARIALLGAGSRGEFREEDQIGCAWIAAKLIGTGYAPEDQVTAAITNRWANAKAADCLVSKSADYLRSTSQLSDLEFILGHINDLDDTFIVEKDDPVACYAANEPLRRQVQRVAG